MAVTDFYMGLKVLWEELENLRPMPQCICPVRCTCEAMRNVKRYKDQDYKI